MKKVLLVATLLFALIIPTRAMAQIDVFPQCGSVDSAVCKGGGKLFGAGSIWNKILNLVTYVGGAAAVLVIILGGLKYVMSNGDQSQITSAKNTILYAVIGLIVAIAANAIINFVLSSI